MRVLFVSWDGPGPNYHESLFLPIFAQSRRPDDEIHLLQYAWEADERAVSVRAAAQRLGMPYTARPVWRTPQAPATAAMIVRGAFDLVRYARRHRIEVLMPRSIIPAGMALLALRFLPGVQLLFDADGLMADERADFGGWSREAKPYRALRAIEAAAVRRADVVITRTQRAKKILAERAGLIGGEVDTNRPLEGAPAQRVGVSEQSPTGNTLRPSGPRDLRASPPSSAMRCPSREGLVSAASNEAAKIVVVSNGKDAEAFHPSTAAERSNTRRELGLPDETPLLVYAGSLGPHYYPDRMAAFAATVQARRPEAHLLILTGSPDVAHEAARTRGLDASSYTVRRVPPEDVPRYLAAADLGLAFRTASLSQQAVAPIKVGEYLLCGLPVLSTSGIGDLDDQLGAATGRLLDSLDDAALDEAAGWFIEEVLPARERYRANCRERGLEHFSLACSAEQYREAFDMLDEAHA